MTRPRLELRESSDGASWTLSGENPYGVAYPVRDFRGSYEETLSRGAFREHLAGSPTVPLRVEHNPHSPALASTGRSGTMRLTETSAGLQVRADLAKDDPDCRAAVTKVRRGLLDRLSVGMFVDRDTWSQDQSQRTVHAAKLGEISLVLMPANPGATASVRGATLDGMEVRYSPTGIALVTRQMGDGTDDATIDDGGEDQVICPACGWAGDADDTDGGECPECGAEVDTGGEDGRAARAEGELRRKYDSKSRQALARQGKALPDGSYPVRDRADLKNAVAAFGRAKDPAKVKAHIIARARALNALDLLPQSWRVQRSRASSPAELRRRGAILTSRAAEAELLQLRRGMPPTAYDRREALRRSGALATEARLRGDFRLARALDRSQEIEFQAQALGVVMNADQLARDLAEGWELPLDCAPWAMDDRVRRGFKTEVGSWPTLALALSRAKVSATRPAWVGDEREADAWLIVAPGIVIPLVWVDDELHATCVLTESFVRRGRAMRRAARRRR